MWFVWDMVGVWGGWVLGGCSEGGWGDWVDKLDGLGVWGGWGLVGVRDVCMWGFCGCSKWILGCV
jgi:hypothetical protein